MLPRSCGTIGEVLRQNGYMTAWIGKNHNTPTWETSAAGPFDRWANGLGFDYFYGFNAGDMNHWNPVLFENRNLVRRSADPDYHLTEDLADKAIAWVRKVKSIAPDKPFFLYVAPGANALAAPCAEGVDREVQGKVRRRLGQVPRGDLRAAEEARRDPAGRQAHAAVGGLAGLGYAQRGSEEAVRADDGGVRGLRGTLSIITWAGSSTRSSTLPGAENTIFIYIVGDNGEAHEGGIEGSVNENLFFNGFPEKWQDNLKVIDELGGPQAVQPLPIRLGARDGHAVPVDQAGRQPSRRHSQPDDHVLARARSRTKEGCEASSFTRSTWCRRSTRLIGITPPLELQRRPAEADRRDQFRIHVRRRERQGAGGPRSTSSWVQYAASTTTAGWRQQSRSPRGADPRRGSTSDKQKWELYNIDEDCSQANDLGGRRTRGSSARCRTCGGLRRPGTTFCRSIGGHVERLNAELMGRPSLARRTQDVYVLPGSDRACPTRRPRGASTSRGRSRRTSKFRKTARRA